MTDNVAPIRTPIKAIRAKCLDCCAGQAQEVRLCPCHDCPLYPYRMGHNPSRKGKGGNPAQFAKKSATQPCETGTGENGEGKDMAEDERLNCEFERKREEEPQWI